MNSWKPDWLLRLLLSWTALTFITFWLPLIRGLMDGATYHWAGHGFSGSGVGGDYWFPVLGSVFAILLLFLGWRGARQPFHWLLLAWHLYLAGAAVSLALTQPELLRFQGDTLGVDISLAWVGPVLFGGFALLAILWVIRDLRGPRSRHVPAWSARNQRYLWLALGLLPVQFVLLRFGPPHGTTDQIGVLVTLTQWVLINLAFYPWSPQVRPLPAVSRRLAANR